MHFLRTRSLGTLPEMVDVELRENVARYGLLGGHGTRSKRDNKVASHRRQQKGGGSFSEKIIAGTALQAIGDAGSVRRGNRYLVQ